MATEGGFTAAARQLNIGQPTVSSHVGNLEGYFGVELFHRAGRRIQLTEIGRKLYDITHDLFGHEQEAIACLKARQNRPLISEFFALAKRISGEQRD